MLASYFKGKAIEKKLLIMHLLVAGSALALVFVLTIAYQFIKYKNELVSDISSQLSLVAENLGAPVVYDEKLTATDILRSLRLNRSIDQAYIELENGSRFAEYRLAEGAGMRNGRQQILEVEKGAIHLSKEIFVNGHTVGKVYLDANLSKIYERIKVFAITLFMAVLWAMFLARYVSKRLNIHITEPIRYLERMVNNITRNNEYSERSTIETKDEIGALSEGINGMLDGIKFRDDRLIEELQQRIVVEQKLDRLAYYDNQTKLPNRHAFTEYINKLVGVGSGGTAHFYLLMLDLDNFKVVNDTLGHEEGDQLLKQCGQRLRWILDENDTVFRIGGDEFAIILKGVKSIHDVEKICLRITSAISKQFMIGPHEIFIGVSIGVVQYRNNNFTESDLIKSADMAMYWAKSAGKNTYKFYSTEIETAHYYHQKLTNDLQKVVQDNELVLYYQPIISVETSRIVGFEALLRWQHPEGGIVSPNVFIPIAEHTGMIAPIGGWAINAALQQLKDWQNQYGQTLFVNINVSARQFFDKRIVNMIGSAIKNFSVDPGTLNFELTESILMEDVDKATSILLTLKEMGVGIAVDDFGTGHSSMSYLKQFPVDTIKIDKSFIRGLPTDEVDMAIIEAIFALAKSLNLDVVAEGVETEEQFDFLKDRACTKVQGYLFSEPVPADKAGELLYQSNVNAKRVGNYGR